jgi:uridine kinase
MNSKRVEALNQIVDSVLEIERPHPVRVAIDGVDAAGKTTLADELAPAIERCGRSVIRASIDGFHRPRVDRYRRGANSPEGYYYDSFDYIALIDNLLIPLGPDGNRCFRRALYDYRVDEPLHPATEEAPEDAVLLLDGVFLMRQELNRYWDFRIYVDVDFEVAVGRAISRDRGGSRSHDQVLRRYWEKYVPGQLIYIESVQPKINATLIMNNDEFANPIIFKV